MARIRETEMTVHFVGPARPVKFAPEGDEQAIRIVNQTADLKQDWLEDSIFVHHFWTDVDYTASDNLAERALHMLQAEDPAVTRVEFAITFSMLMG